jgi:hypothetical protein
MSEERRASDQPGVKPKKPYQKPDFRLEKVFETTALACNTKNNAGNAGCGHPFKS